MKIKEVKELTGLSDRTIRYYIEQELIFPSFSENYLGRKAFDFTQKNIEELKSIAVLRKFEFTIEEIKKIIDDAQISKAVIRDVIIRTEQMVSEGQKRLTVLSHIKTDKAYTVAELAEELSKSCEDVPVLKETVKINIAKKILDIVKSALVFAAVWLPVAIQIIFFMATINYYDYPKFYPEAIVYMILSVLPSFLMLLIGKMKKSWEHTARNVLLVFCILSLLCSFVAGMFPIGSMAVSETTDIVEYRDFDADCFANSDLFFQKMFPVWPKYFEDVEQADGSCKTVYLDAHYYYRYLSIMDYTYDVYAEWPLDEEAFNKEVERVTELFMKNAPDTEDENSHYNLLTVTKGNYTCLVLYHGDPVFEEVTDSYTYYIFAYDRDNLKVRYICCCSLENGADQPYYLNLDW